MEKSNKLLCYPSIDDKNLSGATLVMPAISVGNIGQLAVDILLATLHAKRLTSFYHPSLVPLVGSDPLDAKSTELMTACDIYLPRDYTPGHSAKTESNSKNFILMQIRSAIPPNKSNEFLDDLLSWCVKVGICRVVLLSSSSADERVDSQITGSKLRFLENGLDGGLKDTFKKLNWIEMETKYNFPAKLGNAPKIDDSIENRLFLPGSGYTKSLHLKSLDTRASYAHISFVSLLMFASEGDNSGDAIQLVSYLDDWLKLLHEDKGLSTPRLQFPVSWQALFGNAPPAAIF